MKRSKVGNKESEYNALFQQFLKLQEDWDSFKRSNKPLNNCPQISTQSDSTSATLDFFKLLENSPRSLMSSLQNSKSPIEGVNWKVKKNDLVVEEIIRDRRTALASGKLKGRRLFGENEDQRSSITTASQEISEEVCSDCLVLLKEKDDKNIENVGNDDSFSCTSTSSFTTEKTSKGRVEGNHKASVNLVKRKSWRCGTYLWLLVMALFAITISAFAQGIFLIAGNQVEGVIEFPT